MTDKQPLVLGLDLAAESTGVALPDGNTLTIKAPKPRGKKRVLLDDLDRIDHVATTVSGLLAQHRVDLAVIEDYAPGIRSAAAHRLAEISGTVRWICHAAGLPIALVNIKHLKAYATGKATADKGEMRIAALKRAAIEFPNDDECDAWWLRAMALDHFGHPLVADMPAKHRAVLDKVAWPEVTT